MPVFTAMIVKGTVKTYQHAWEVLGYASLELMVDDIALAQKNRTQR